MGISRSATIVASYLIKEKGYNNRSALAAIRQVRAEINPNHGFREQLKAWSDLHSCELCALEKRTEWFEENKDYTVLLCE
jgi:protein-tyrosine phosphatase